NLHQNAERAPRQRKPGARLGTLHGNPAEIGFTRTQPLTYHANASPFAVANPRRWVSSRTDRHFNGGAPWRGTMPRHERKHTMPQSITTQITDRLHAGLFPAVPVPRGADGTV